MKTEEDPHETQGSIEALRMLSTTEWPRRLLRRPGAETEEIVELEDEACRWEQWIVLQEVLVLSERTSASSSWADPVVVFLGRTLPWTFDTTVTALRDQWPDHVHPSLRGLVSSISTDAW